MPTLKQALQEHLKEAEKPAVRYLEETPSPSGLIGTDLDLGPQPTGLDHTRTSWRPPGRQFQVHRESHPNPTSCPRCGSSSYAQDQYSGMWTCMCGHTATHMKRWDRPQNHGKRTEKVQCPHCSKPFYDPEKLHHHVALEHGDEVPIQQARAPRRTEVVEAIFHTNGAAAAAPSGVQQEKEEEQPDVSITIADLPTAAAASASLAAPVSEEEPAKVSTQMVLDWFLQHRQGTSAQLGQHFGRPNGKPLQQLRIKISELCRKNKLKRLKVNNDSTVLYGLVEEEPVKTAKAPASPAAPPAPPSPKQTPEQKLLAALEAAGSKGLKMGRLYAVTGGKMTVLEMHALLEKLRNQKILVCQRAGNATVHILASYHKAKEEEEEASSTSRKPEVPMETMDMGNTSLATTRQMTVSEINAILVNTLDAAHSRAARTVSIRIEDWRTLSIDIGGLGDA